ncbi:MAG: ribosomal-processing cysteine protease Prp [Bacilli bacterium]|jgi:uncharacterized protein YsxB (DUF464 family)
MIQVRVVYDNNDSLSSLSIKGHGLAGFNKDLVCAGVSSCFVGAMNALKDSSHKIRIESGDSEIIVSKDCSAHDEVVLETLIIQLETIQQSHSNEVKITVSGKEG